MKRFIWIDSDLAISDVFAIIGAINLPNIEIVGISTVFGRRSVDENYDNAKKLLSLLNKTNINVYKGASKPLIVDTHFDDNKVDVPCSSIIKDTNESAIDALYKKAKELNGELTVVSIAPLTNIASAIFKYPDIVKYIKEIVYGGGSVGKGGSYTLAAEKNTYFDPHAAQSVFKSGIPVTMIGLDVMMKSYLTSSESELLKEIKGDVGSLIDKATSSMINSSKKLKGDDKLFLFDLCPFLYVNNPSIYKGRKAGVYVETESPLSIGRTVSDIFVHADELFKVKNVMVMIEADNNTISKEALDSFSNYR